MPGCNVDDAVRRVDLDVRVTAYALTIKSSIETNNGETQGQLALEGVGIARVCAETVEQAIKAGQLVSLLEQFNPGDGEAVHAVFVGGARIRSFVAYLAENLRTGKHPPA